jgi:hypothetical protein
LGHALGGGEDVAAQRIRVAQVVKKKFGRVESPEELVVDRERRYAEHVARDGFFAVAPQGVLDGGICDQIVGIGGIEAVGKSLPFSRVADVAAFAPDEIEDCPGLSRAAAAAVD